MEKALVIIGGVRVGDLFHLIPFFDSIKDKEIHWVTGTYERDAAEIIKWMYPNITSLEFFDDGLPMDLNSREIFKNKFYEKYENSKLNEIYDDIYDDYTVSFDISPLYWKLKDTYFPMIKRSKGDYIVYHLDTISDWKRHTQIRDLKIDNAQGYSLGTKSEFVLPGTIDFTNKPLTEVVSLIAGAKLFVGIHSALSCLSLYVNPSKAVVIHPFDGLLKFSDYRENFKDIIQPTTEQLKKAIDERINI